MTCPSPFVLSPPTKPGPMLHALFNPSLLGIPAEHEGPAFSSSLSHVGRTKWGHQSDLLVHQCCHITLLCPSQDTEAYLASRKSKCGLCPQMYPPLSQVGHVFSLTINFFPEALHIHLSMPGTTQALTLFVCCSKWPRPIWPSFSTTWQCTPGKKTNDSQLFTMGVLINADLLPN